MRCAVYEHGHPAMREKLANADAEHGELLRFRCVLVAAFVVMLFHLVATEPNVVTSRTSLCRLSTSWEENTLVTTKTPLPLSCFLKLHLLWGSLQIEWDGLEVWFVRSWLVEER